MSASKRVALMLVGMVAVAWGLSVQAAGPAETNTGVTGPGGVVFGTGPSLTANGSLAVPTIDGTISAGEWTDATSLDISISASPVVLYLKHNGSFLYLAFDDQADTALDSYDQVGVYFDDEGGTAPILYDNIWTAAACPADEGNFWLGNFTPDPDDQFRGFAAGPTACTVQYGSTNTSVAYGVSSGHMQYEVAINLSTSALQAVAGDTFGLRVYSAHLGSTFTGRWPNPSTFNDPATYGNLTLDPDVPVELQSFTAE